MLLQIYEIGSPEEARAVAALGVDHIGVLVGRGAFPREHGAAAARAIFAVCPARAKRVALSLSPDPGEIARVVEQAGPDIVHLGAAAEHFGPEQSAEVKRRYPGVKLMRSIPVVDETAIAFAKAHEGIADFLLLDSHAPGDAQIGALGRTHDWRLSRRIVGTVAIPCILAGGLGPDNVADAIRTVRPAGVDSKTKTDVEGTHAKDLEKVRAFAAAARG
ncbi:MAG: phosphoribosylanthranilate isomerase [Rhodospirillaceae bacterium]|nr:phosphoribosylanthranilate isomerase [Rhodospirillaceae bacterium]